MKTFTNKTTTISKADGHSDYADLAIICLEYKKQGEGLTIEEMGYKLSLIHKFRDLQKLGQSDSPSYLQLEDAEAKKVLESMNLMDGHWGVLHQDLVSFYADVRAELA